MDLFKSFFAINPIDNEVAVKSYYNVTLNKFLPDGTKITGKFLIDTYTEYIESLQSRQAGRFTKKEDRILGPLEWLANEIYLKPIIKTKNPNDFYLYGLE